MKKIVACLVLLLAVGFTFAQEQELPRLDSIDKPSPAYLVVCDSDPSKIIVLDVTGKWLSEVKTASIVIKIGSPATLRCELYSGSIRPSRPNIMNWDLAQVQSVTNADFQSMIDNLQTDPTYVKRSREAGPVAPVIKKTN